MTRICNVLYRFMDYDAVNDSHDRIFSCGSVAASFSASQQQLCYFQRQQTVCFRDAVHNRSVSHAAV